MDFLNELRDVGIVQRKASELVDYAALKADYLEFMQTERPPGREGGISKPHLLRKFEHHATIPRSDILAQTAEHLAKIVEGYLGPGVTISEINHWFAKPWDGDRVASQNWHRDLPGALPVVKVFIFYAPVDEDGGPFQYLLESRLGRKYEKTFPSKIYNSYVPGELVDSVLSPEDVVTVTCPEDTIVFCDTSGLHRGGYCLKSPRLSSTFGFWPSFPPGEGFKPIIKIVDP